MASFVNRLRDYVTKKTVHEHEKTRFSMGELQCQLMRQTPPKKFNDAEFRVYSQYGQDGIIQYLISQIPGLKETFVEFGVQNYAESNTRFLLQKWNWAGLIIDGNSDHLLAIEKLGLSWQHDITALQEFITRENINDIIGRRFTGEIGILSIDVDGMEYWLWDALTVVNPQIVIVEYNSVYGLEKVTAPYSADHSWDRFDRTFAYCNASLGAYKHLAEKKGFTFVGCDSSGTDAFFVRNDLAQYVSQRGDFVFRKSYWNVSPGLLEKYGHLPLADVTDGRAVTLRQFFERKPVHRIGLT